MQTFAEGVPRPPWILLEDRLGGSNAYFYSDPVEVVCCADPSDVETAIRRIDHGLASGLYAAGVFSYELAYALEPKLAGRMPGVRPDPLIWMGLFPPPQRVDSETLDEYFGALAPPPPILDLKPGRSRSQHKKRVGQVLDLIEAGDVYQVNLTFPFCFHYLGDPLCLYAALRARQPVAHGGVAMLGELSVLSVSPELWLEAEGSLVRARPMKGTCPRGADENADAAAKAALAIDPKQQAENLMIVDLLRNDLSRVCVPGTVKVPKLFSVETYPTFHTLTSTIVGRLDPLSTLKDQITALFPCGSIVGAPKLRAGEIIRDLESEPRGLYTGGLGAIAPNGDLRFNVAIRTAMIRPDGEGRYGVGGGVVAESDPDEEYDEALLKGRVVSELSQDFGLIETLRWSRPDGFVRLQLHLDRLERSARALAFKFDRSEALRLLQVNVTQALAKGSDLRVRLLLHRGGELAITSLPHQPSKDALKVVLSEIRFDQADPFLRHKTTRRDLYDLEFERNAALGFDEVLFLNRRGEATEASRNSLFVKIGSELITPPVHCGLLPGVFRRFLLEDGRAIEALVTEEQLRSHPIFLGNSLHGLRPATLLASCHSAL